MLDDEEAYEPTNSQTEPSPVEDKKYSTESQSSTSQSQNQRKSGGLSLVSMRNNPSKKTRIKIMEPRLYSEVKDIADLILTNQSVVLNFRRMENDQAKKVIDFMMGVTYAIEGDIQRVGDQIFLCTPADIEIDANEISTLDTTE